MKIAFIKPNMISGTPADSMEPLVFAVLSALTPQHIERCLYDERLEEIPYDEPADLVAITADTFSAKRAYQIADRYRKKGVPVVIGGFHPTLCPDEAGCYADSIVIGDAEDTWPQIIADAQNHTLQPKYVSVYPSFGIEQPDRSLFRGKTYAPISLVEFQRGCRFSCEFCSIHAAYRGKVRRRAIESVLRDIDNNCKQLLFFTDDNLYADIPSLTELLTGLKQRKIRWSCQISTDIANHPELIPLMAEAGCLAVLVGFESLSKNNLKQMRKAWAGDSYRQLINIFQDNGIMVYGTFIIGYDDDTPDVFEQTLQFALTSRLFLANFNPLIPAPGTPLYSRLQSEERLLYDSWWLDQDYRWGNCAFRPRRLSPEELTEGVYQIRRRFNSRRGILARFPGLKFCKTSLYKAGLFLTANLLSRRELRRKYGRALGEPPPADYYSEIKDTAGCTSR